MLIDYVWLIAVRHIETKIRMRRHLCVIFGDFTSLTYFQIVIILVTSENAAKQGGKEFEILAVSVSHWKNKNCKQSVRYFFASRVILPVGYSTCPI